MTEQQGMFTVPTLIFLTPEQREKLERIVREQEIDLADLVTQVVSDYLDTLPELPPLPPAPVPDRSSELRKRRSELARLHARREAAGSDAPAWLDSYIADMEAEIRRMEQR